MRLLLLSLVLAVIVIPVSGMSPASGGPLLKGGTTEASHYEDAMVTDCPQPEIPSILKEHCFKTSCTARFRIDEKGLFTVRLVSSSGCQEVDDLVLKTLLRWKFRPALIDGKAVKSSRKIKIVFEVE